MRRGKVIFWSKRNGHGFIKDTETNADYVSFDVDLRNNYRPKENDEITFHIDRTDPRVTKAVMLHPVRSEEND